MNEDWEDELEEAMNQAYPITSLSDTNSSEESKSIEELATEAFNSDMSAHDIGKTFARVYDKSDLDEKHITRATVERGFSEADYSEYRDTDLIWDFVLEGWQSYETEN